MAIAFVRGADDGSLGFGASSMSLTFAATPSDDEIILLAYIQTVSGPATRTWPSGFTEIVSALQAGGDSLWLSAAWKKAASESSATYTLTLGDSGDSNQQLIGGCYSGADLTTPFEVVGSTFSGGFGSPQSAPAITTLTDNAWHIVIFGSNDQPSTPASSGYTNDRIHASFARTALIHKAITPAGSTGTPSFTGLVGSGNPNAFLSLAMKPAGGGGGGGSAIAPISSYYHLAGGLR